MNGRSPGLVPCPGPECGSLIERDREMCGLCVRLEAKRRDIPHDELRRELLARRRLRESLRERNERRSRYASEPRLKRIRRVA